MAQPAHRAEWLPAPLAWIALAAAGAGVAAHAFVGLQGAYVNYASGVWLSLARDLASHGVLYRDLTSELGYGGTRYFPFFFVIIAGLLKIGVAPTVAGLTAGSLSLGILATAAYRIVRAVGAPVLTAAVFAVGAAAPYFALQAAFGVRADVMAAGLNLLGVAMLLPAWTSPEAEGRRVWPAVTAFLLAFATKVTAFTIPAGLVAVALVTARRRLATRLAVALAGAGTVFLGLVHLASEGRAFHVWNAVMFADADSKGTLLSVLSGGYRSGLFNSHLVSVVMVTSVLALLAGAAQHRLAGGIVRLPLLLPAGLWLTATATMGLTLASPGTVPANQVVEWLAISMLVPALVAVNWVSARRAAAVVSAVLVIWMAAQNVSREREKAPLASAEHHASERAFLERVRALGAPILSESALWPIFAGQDVVMPDPFAARIVLRAHPEMEARLVEEIDARRYRGIVLDFDPTSKQGEAMYGFSHFNPRIIAAVRARYRLERGEDSIGFLFVPKD